MVLRECVAIVFQSWISVDHLYTSTRIVIQLLFLLLLAMNYTQDCCNVIERKYIYI